MINQITLVGFLGRDAQKKALPNGTPVLNFSLATKKVWKDGNNEWQERTQWHQVVCFGDRMARLTERLVEGTLVYVQGELTTRDRLAHPQSTEWRCLHRSRGQATRSRSQSRCYPYPGSSAQQ